MSAYLIALSINVEISLFSFFIIIPVVEIVRMIPITIGGIGLREGTFIYFLGILGIQESSAAIIAFFFYGFLMLNGLIGGILYGYKSLTVRETIQGKAVAIEIKE